MLIIKLFVPTFKMFLSFKNSLKKDFNVKIVVLNISTNESLLLV